MEILESGFFYHVYNHANGNENLFKKEENYNYFLIKYHKHVSPIVETWAYCLMPNHFHFLIRVKDDDIISKSFPKFQTLEKLQQSNFISKQFSNFFSSYTQAFNKVYNRRGSLFIKNFERKRISSELYLKQAIIYIHNNPVYHEFVEVPERWKFSSYDVFGSEKQSYIMKNEVVSLFDDIRNFRDAHKTKADEIYARNISLEY